MTPADAAIPTDTDTDTVTTRTHSHPNTIPAPGDRHADRPQRRNSYR